MADRILVTGGSGMLGASLVRSLIERGDDVTIASRRGADLWRLEGIADTISIVEFDYLDSDDVASRVAEILPRTVFHLSSTPFNPPTIAGSAHFDANVRSTVNLLEAIRKADLDCQLIFTGSCAAYGEGAKLQEDAPARPATLLGAAKQSARIVLEAYARLHNMKTLNLCLFTPYGPWEAPGRLIPHIVLSTLRGQPIAMTEGRQQRDFLAMDDVIDAFLAAAVGGYPPGATVNICSGRPTAVRDLAQMLLKVLKSDAEPDFGALPTRPDEIMIISGDNSRAAELFDWRPKVTLEDGLERSVAWYIENRHLYE